MKIDRRSLLGMFAVGSGLALSGCQGVTLATVSAQVSTWVADIGNGLEAAAAVARVALPASITDLIGRISGLAATITTKVETVVASPTFQQIMKFASQLSSAVAGFSGLPSVVVDAASYVMSLIPSIASFFGIPAPAAATLRSTGAPLSPEDAARGLEGIIARAAASR